MRTIHFNTGRKYIAAGQPITATLHDDGVVTFHDHARMIDGEFALPMHAQFNQVEVLHWYDAGQAPNTARSWQDAFLRGGCNSKYEGK